MVAPGGLARGVVVGAVGLGTGFVAAGLAGIAWNLLNVGIVCFLLWHATRSMRAAATAYTGAHA